MTFLNYRLTRWHSCACIANPKIALSYSTCRFLGTLIPINVYAVIVIPVGRLPYAAICPRIHDLYRSLVVIITFAGMISPSIAGV